jgi:hypothetical protein
MYDTANKILAAARELEIERARFRQVAAQRFAAVLNNVLTTFTRSGTRNNDTLWLWEDLKEPTYSLVQSHRPGILREVTDAATPVWLITEDWDRTKRHGNYWLFEGEFGAVLDVLEHVHRLEYYVVARKFEWLLLENHHGGILGAGEWIVQRLHAIDALLPGTGRNAR